MCMCVYIYTYIEREREREREDTVFAFLRIIVCGGSTNLWFRDSCVVVSSNSGPFAPHRSGISRMRFIHSSNRIPCSSKVCCLFVSCLVRCLAILRIEGCLNSTF